MVQVKVGADVNLSRLTMDWLAKHDRTEPERHLEELLSEMIVELPLSVVRNREVDIISQVEERIDAQEVWNNKIEAEEYLHGVYVGRF